MLDVKKIRNDFPILSRRINGKPLAYLDNAATSQKPKQVIDAISDYYSHSNANVHRGAYVLSEESTEMFEGARKKVAGFVGAEGANEIVFTRNCTESLNIAVSCLSSSLKRGDRVLLSVAEHHSNLVSWQGVQKKGVALDFLSVNNDGKLDMAEVVRKITKKTKIVSIAHASNVLGTINDVRAIAKIAHEKDALVVVDGAQSVPHMPIDVQKLGCDFFAFSGHKMLAPMGAGVLWARKEILDEAPPFLRGGEMIKSVSEKSATWNDAPWKFEAGTPDVASAIGLGAAIDYLQKIGMGNVQKYGEELTKYCIDELSEIDGIEMYGPRRATQRTPLVSFNLQGIHPHDMATLLDREGIAIRAGHACAQPLMKVLGVPAVCRASFQIYNTKSEIDRLHSALLNAKRLFAK
jgi:cysteine desulfurase/selenocysteine lyase